MSFDFRFSPAGACLRLISCLQLNYYWAVGIEAVIATQFQIRYAILFKYLNAGHEYWYYTNYITVVFTFYVAEVHKCRCFRTGQPSLSYCVARLVR
jgi:hypothetical protein